MKKRFNKNVNPNKDRLKQNLEICIDIFDKKTAVDRIMKYIDSTIEDVYSDCETQQKFRELILIDIDENII